MSYKNATQHLPRELLEQVQKYVDGEYLYIPRVDENRQQWGAGTKTRQELSVRNGQIYEDFDRGMRAEALAEKYFLSVKSIQRIVAREKKARRGG